MRSCDRYPVLAVVAAVALLLSMAAVANPAAATTAQSESASSPVTADHDHRSVAKKPRAKMSRYKPAGCATLTAAQRSSPVPHARCYALEYTTKAGKMLSRKAGPPSTATTPEEFQDAYNLPDGGAGVTVAIMGAFGYSTAEEDLAVYRDYYGLPPCTSENGCFTTIDQRGGTDFPADDGGWSVEAAMDMDAVSAVCPKCNILLVQADSNSFEDLGKAVDTAADQPGVVAISNSYGVDGEDPDQTDYDQYYEHSGIAVVVSSGDTSAVQSWPATNPTVVAVGGTSLTEDDSQRGWHESVWGNPSGLGDGAGSGCSLYEPRPEWQQDVDTTCASHKATADISADADPATGIAVYNTIGRSGWSQWGGTSLSAPLVAGMYGLAGTPTPGTYPVSYAYADPSALFDVTDGANGPCGTKLCAAGPGWDGPTGLGTPNGVTALRQADTGQVVGTVTDSDSGAPLGGVRVTAVDADGNEFPTVTGSDGTYDLFAPAGTYSVTASKFGYESTTTDGVQVAVGEQVAVDLALVERDTQTVAGYVTDGSGHGWPMRAKITVEGHADASVFSDPYTGYYQLSLPEGQSYTLHASSADLPGYKTQDATVDLTDGHLLATPPHTRATGNAQAKGWAHGKAKGHQGKVSPAYRRTDLTLDVDGTTCTAPGYGYTYNGFGTAFEGWTGNEPQSGWTIVDNQGNGQTWRFDDPGNRGNLTGGGGNFAVIDSGAYGPAKHQDTSLVSPVTDLSGMDSPKISFDTDYEDWLGDSASVDVSVDGGQTWTNIWHKEAHGIFNGHVEIPIPSAANQSQVQLRFHYIGFYSWFWEIDNVVVGNRSCDLTDGGLVAGIVTDHNTGDPVDGATVTSDVNDDEFGVTTQTPEDANLSDGYYWLFSSHAGRTGFTGSKGQYAPTSDTVDVPVDYVQHTDLELRAGHLTIDKSSIKATERMGRAKSRTLTFGNDGTEPVHVQLGETVGGFTALNGQHLATTPGAPKQVVKTQTSVAALVSDTKQAPVFGNQAKKSPPLTVHGQKVQLRRPVPADRAWSPIADYPKPVMDDAVAYHNGKVYVVGGSDGSSTYSDAYVYDPSAQSWSAIADLPEALSAASAVFVGDTLYVVGGWDAAGDASSHAYAYDPGSDSWTQLADMPGSVSAAGLAALQGKLYVVGGCTNGQCTSSTDSVHSYDPGSNTWSEEPAYPTPVSFTACGGIGGEVVCAGGVNSSTSLTATYALVPGSGSWTQKADLPMDAWAASYAAANGELEVMGGAINNGHALTNQGYAYDPAADEWAGLPSSNNAVYRGGAACGLFKVGGFTGRNPVAFGETLPGYGNCGGGGDVAWLSQSKAEFDVAPGDSVTVRVSLDSGAVSKPGDYRAKVGVSANTPYQVEPVDVAMHVQPPRRWGKVAGTVTDTEGNPLAGATVQICTMWDRYLGCGPVTYTLKTDADGHYQLWLNQGYNPLAIIVAKPGYQPKFELTRIHRGETTTANFTLAGT